MPMEIPLISAKSLEEQYELWLRLADALERAQHSLLTGELKSFEHCTEEQRACCEKLRQLASDSIPAQEQTDPSVAAWNERIDQIRRKVRHLNRVHAALLRRASRSLQILRNLMAGTSRRYTPAEGSATSLLSRV
jgi:flagellar biosynthesis/type III secretory pathway chaperone